MMKWFFTGIILISIICAMVTGRMPEVSKSALSEGIEAVKLCLTLAGSMCLWSGVMRVAQKGGITKLISKLLSPVTAFLFKGLKKGSRAMDAISMNITANLLGLGNAATPLGISAMAELASATPEAQRDTASNHMAMLVIINTASIQLIPTTVAALRVTHGSAQPLDILPAVWICSLCSLASAVMLAKLFEYIGSRRKRKKA